MLHMRRLTAIITVLVLVLGFGFNGLAYKHWDDYTDCDRDKIVHQFRQACITLKRSANFYQPSHSRNIDPVELESEEDSVAAASLLLGHLSPRFPRQIGSHSKGQENNHLQTEGSVHSPGKLANNDILQADASKQLKQKRRRARRDALLMLNELIYKCCSTDGGCSMSDFISYEQKVKYCDTEM